MKEIITKVYELDELNDKAKEKARDWFKSTISDDTFWYECVIDDAKNLASLMGINISKIYFSGFSSQGDGACFIGNFDSKEVKQGAVKQEAPNDEELNRIASEFERLAKVFPNLTFNTKHNTVRYNHENSVDFDFEFFQDEDEANIPEQYKGNMGQAVQDVKEASKDFMRWIYKQLEKEWDYQNSNECVDENIRANEYTFTESGVRFG
jgi:hypothetical protein